MINFYCLRYLATGDEVLSLAHTYRIGESTAYMIIRETCQVIFEILSPIYLRFPCRPVWRNICKGFYTSPSKFWFSFLQL